MGKNQESEYVYTVLVQTMGYHGGQRGRSMWLKIDRVLRLEHISGCCSMMAHRQRWCTLHERNTKGPGFRFGREHASFRWESMEQLSVMLTGVPDETPTSPLNVIIRLNNRKTRSPNPVWFVASRFKRRQVHYAG